MTFITCIAILRNAPDSVFVRAFRLVTRKVDEVDATTKNDGREQMPEMIQMRSHNHMPKIYRSCKKFYKTPKKCLTNLIKQSFDSVWSRSDFLIYLSLA